MSRRHRGFLRFHHKFSIPTPSGKLDYLFIIPLVVLLCAGILILSSASVVVSFQKFATPYYYTIHQLVFGLLPGLLLCFFVSRIEYHYWRRFSFFFLIISVFLLILVFIPGVGFGYGGAHRWIHIGPFLFQPSEAVKLTFLLYMAAWLSAKGEKTIKDFSYGFLPFAFLTGLIALLVIAQPDIGTMSIIAIIALTMYFIAGARPSHIVLVGFGAITLFFILVQTASYRLKRFMTFLHPELDPLGIGYHINQALLAVGSGGLFGRGLGHSRQKFAYLPEVTGDSIFAIAAEELGLFLSIVLILLFLVIAFRGFHIARRASDTFGKLVAVGISAWIFFQSFINIGAMLSILPLTGVPLPFISYGGSSLLVLLTAVGILMNISRKKHERL